MLRPAGVYALNVIDVPPLDEVRGARRADARRVRARRVGRAAGRPARRARRATWCCSARAVPLPLAALRRAAAAAVPREQVLRAMTKQAARAGRRDHGLVRRGARRDGGQRRAAGDPRRPRRRARRPAVGLQRVPADARLADPRRRLAGRPLRRAARVLDRRRRASASCRVLCALAPTIEVLVAGRALQGVFGALLTPSALAVIIAAFPPDERGAAIGSWTAWSGIAIVIGPLAAAGSSTPSRGAGSSPSTCRSCSITLVLVAIAVPRRERAPRACASTGSARVLTVLGLAGPGARADPPAGVGWSPQVWAAARSASRCSAAVRAARAPHAGADAAAGAVHAPQLRVRQPPDVRHVRRARRDVLLPHAVPAAGRGLRRARGRAWRRSRRRS